jgi:DNA polymerase
MKYLIFDYETRSELDLKTNGAYEYARHPSTEILCVGWQVLSSNFNKETKTQVWSPFIKGGNISELLYHLCNPDTMVVAHNAFFEQVITRFVLTRYFPHPELKILSPSRFICTASLAATLALPRNLEGAALALKLPVQKDMEGRKLILKYCKPRKATKANARKFHNRREDLLRIMKYCGTDIDATIELFKKLPALNPNERRVWELNQKINFRGFNTDQDLVKITLALIDQEINNLDNETNSLTRGYLSSTTQRDGVLYWLKKEGLALPDLTANTVKDALAGSIQSDVARRLLEIRQAVSKTSTAKYAAFKMRGATDARIRDYLLYHGASTGRDAGQGVQPQNFPRGTIKDTAQAVEVVKTGDLELIRMIYGNPMNVFASCLRGVIIPTPGRELFCSDYSGIEARVLLWLANDVKGLEVFKSGRDPYKIIAARIYNKKYEDVTGAERELGKRAELACGFGMGWKKFIETCKSFGDKSVDEQLAKKAVNVFREVHAPVVKLWSNLEKAAIYAVQNPGKKITINKTAWFMRREILYCELPSGRSLAYYDPEIRFKMTPWGEKRQTLYHWSVHPITRKWVCDGTYGGKLAENVTQAVARDIMKNGELNLEQAGYEILLAVHDEVLSECKIGEGSVSEYDRLMQTLPPWANGCPIKTKGWTGDRYKKA